MEEEVKKFATEETYLDSLADDYRKTTLKSITEVSISIKMICVNLLQACLYTYSAVCCGSTKWS